VKKYYGFSQNSLFSVSGLKKGIPIRKQFHNYSYSSLCIANLLLRYLDEEIAEYCKENYQ
jgi:hypothetical protein